MAATGKNGPKISRALAKVRALPKSSGKIRDRVQASRLSAMLKALRAKDYGRAGRVADQINRS